MTDQTRSSFYWPMKCMGAPKREAMRVLYAFCREVDDIADGEESTTRKHEMLAHWHEEIGLLFSGNPTHPITQSLAKTMLVQPQNKPYFLGIIEGVRMDVDGVMLCPTLEQLTHYCYGVAGCVGMLALAIMGVDQQLFSPFAQTMGHALQLTNILRDIEVDAAMGRIYLAREWLQDAGVEAVSVQQISGHAIDLEPALNCLRQQAHTYYKQTYAQPMSATQRWNLLPALLMRDVYAQLFKKLQASPRPNRADCRITKWDMMVVSGRLAGYVIRCLLPGGSVQ